MGNVVKLAKNPACQYAQVKSGLGETVCGSAHERVGPILLVYGGKPAFHHSNESAQSGAAKHYCGRCGAENMEFSAPSHLMQCLRSPNISSLERLTAGIYGNPCVISMCAHPAVYHEVGFTAGECRLV